MRKSISQLIAIGAASISTFSYGVSIGFPTILIPELRKEDAEIAVTVAELTWISSLNFFCQPLGAIASGFISSRLGRRNVMALSSLPFTIAWLLLYFSGSSVWPIFLGFILLGATSGLVEGPIEVYVSEISEPRLRGSTASVISTTIVIGSFAPILGGSFIYWRTLALINIAVPVAAFIALCFVPESPYWLASKGRIDDSRNSLAWLRGWTTPENVSNEFSSILEIFKPKSSNTNNKLNLQRYFRRSVFLPFSLITIAFAVYAFGGAVPILTFAVPVYEMLDCPIDKFTASIILAGLQVIATMMMIFLVPWIGKRKTAFASVILAALTMLVVVIFIFLRDQLIIDKIQINEYRWIPTLFISLSVFAASFGIKSIPWIMTGEVFPGDVRAEVTGIVASMSNVFCAIASKVFLYMIDSITLSGTFLTYAIVNFIGFVVLYYIMPETEGRTLAEIERYFEGHRNEDEKNNEWKNKKKRELNIVL